MSLQSKLIFAFLCIALLNISPAFLRITQSQQMQDHLRILIESNLYENEGISQLAYYLQRSKSNLRELLLEARHRPNKEEIIHAKDIVVSSIEKLNQYADILSEATTKGQDSSHETIQENSKEEIESVNNIKLNLEKFTSNATEILGVADNIDDANYYLAMFINTVEPISRDLQDQIDHFKSEEFEEVHNELQSITNHFDTLIQYITISSAISFLLTLMIAVFVARAITANK